MVDTKQKLIARTIPQFARQGIGVHTGHRVEEVDLKRRRIAVRALERHQTEWQSFDQLMLAMGASPIVPAIPGVEAAGVFAVHSLADGLAISEWIEREHPASALVAGGGYIGVEMAENLVRRGLSVTLIDRAPEVMATLDADMGQRVREALTQGGVDVRLNTDLRGIETVEKRVRRVVTDQGTIPADVVVLGLGVVPNSGLVRGLMTLGVKNAIRVDDRQMTEHEGIWSAGDCAETLHLVSGQPFYVALGTVANKQGKVAGSNIAGGSARFPGVVGTAVTTFGETEIARTGLGHKELEDLGRAYAEVTITAKTRAGYIPGASPITVKMTAEKGSGRLMGGQIVGGPGSAKRIDTIATALFARMTVEQFTFLDLGYSPPLSPSWDPVLIAARQLLPLL